MASDAWASWGRRLLYLLGQKHSTRNAPSRIVLILNAVAGRQQMKLENDMQRLAEKNLGKLSLKSRYFSKTMPRLEL
ncbi:hypothetical protein PVA19_12940 [Agrobacterium sp. CNPSo 3708]|jgi:HJR/Mrr/RecB family endonuclease|uniref:hypothetical protein n=1 Tax=Agrobacterium sp. CNPSo 3708 TaxID=3028150 RepID=UPI002364373E|nr:hypothetical protein [Agrobacterium sp. CNPSo 3708]MDD1499323.1 hypothetical protein [Agrobacterium sp. CNPSo 3708]